MAKSVAEISASLLHLGERHNSYRGTGVHGLHGDQRQELKPLSWQQSIGLVTLFLALAWFGTVVFMACDLPTGIS